MLNLGVRGNNVELSGASIACLGIRVGLKKSRAIVIYFYDNSTVVSDCKFDGYIDIFDD